MRWLTSIVIVFPLLVGCANHQGFDVRVQSESKEIQWGAVSNGLSAGIAYEQSGDGPLEFACYLKNASQAPIRILGPGAAARPPVAYELREILGQDSANAAPKQAQLITLQPGETHRSELRLNPGLSLSNYKGEVSFAYSNIATEVLVSGQSVRDLWIGEAVSGSIALTATGRPVDRVRR